MNRLTRRNALKVLTTTGETTAAIPKNRLTRRNALKVLAAGSTAFAVPALALTGARLGMAAGLNDELRVAVIGLGGIDIVGGVGGRGRQLIDSFRSVPGVRIAALCDVDQTILDHEVAAFKDRHEDVAAYNDPRRVFDDKSIDAVVIAMPNHWHALATIWACQAGKDVYVEKPFAHDIWEGRQMVAAARKYNRIVQVGTQRRSSAEVREVIDYVRSGAIGPLRCIHAIVFRGREGIGKVAEPTPVPPTINYDLWCGPTAVEPLMRKQLHYEWHWRWSTGNGELGNNGAHHIDVARWVLGQENPAPRAISIGGRLGYNDDGETANTQIAYFDYQPAPLICEIRNYRAKKNATATGKLRGINTGMVVDCEGGYIAGDFTSSTVFDNDGQKIKAIEGAKKLQELDNLHAANFAAAVRSRKPTDLNAEARVGHVSAACCHMANLSYRLGKQTPPEAIVEATRATAPLADAFDRCRDYLRENKIDLGETPATLGPWLTFDAKSERFVGPFADQANQLSHREGRAPFTVPEIA
jgi:predicted dehydrogenase